MQYYLHKWLILSWWNRIRNYLSTEKKLWTYLVLWVSNGWDGSCGCGVVDATLQFVPVCSIRLWASALELFVKCSLSSVSLFFHQLGHNSLYCLCSLQNEMWFLAQLWRIFVVCKEDVIKNNRPSLNIYLIWNSRIFIRSSE